MTSLIKKITLFTIALLLTACNQPVALATPAQVNLKPTSTQTLILPSTSTPESTSTLIPPTIDPVFFRDDFDEKLGPGWVWMREIPEQWSLSTVPGSLQIGVGSGDVNSQNIANVLLRPAPAGDFQIETKLTFLPRTKFQFAGLVVYTDDFNFLQVGHAYCYTLACSRNGLYMNHYQNGALVPPDFGQPYPRNDKVILRLIRRGTAYIFEVSADGRLFFVVGQHESNVSPLYVGLFAGHQVNGEIIPALFDYFETASAQ